MFNINNLQGRLISYEELVQLGCEQNNSYSLTCNTDVINNNNNRTWIYNRIYWTGSAMNHTSLYYVYGNSEIELGNFRVENGVRPVIVINKSELQKYLDNH